MAVPTGTFQSFQLQGNREDLSDIIDMISPTEVPFQTACKKRTVKATTHEWQTDELDAAGVNANVEGDDAVTNTATPTVRLRNYIQYLDKVAQVSITAEVIDKAGRDSEMAHQVMKRGKELRRDLEFALTQNQGSTAGSSASAPLMAGLEGWLATNRTSVGLGTAQTTPGYASGTVASPTDSSVVGTFTEANLRAVIQATYLAGGEPDMIMVHPAMKSKISQSFSGIATRFREVPSGRQAQIIAGADLYVSDFGEFRVVPNRFQRERTIFVLDMDHWAVGTLIGWTSWKLAKTGASDRKQLYGAKTLIALNEKASGKISDASSVL